MRVRFAGAALTMTALLLVCGSVPGQLISQARVDTFTLEKKNEFKRLMQERDYQPADDPLVELAAQYYIYRPTLVTVQNDRDLLQKIREDFRIETDAAVKYKPAAAKKFAKALLACFAEVFKQSFEQNRLAQTNAALMLPELAQIKSEDVGDFLAKLLADPKKSDVIRMYAARALGEFFAVIPPMEQTIAKSNDVRKQKDPARIQALLDFIDRKWDYKKIDPLAVQYIRREAIKALGQAKIPAVKVDKEQLQAPAALGLLKVLAVPPVLQPPPSLGEKLEAAIGICHLRIDAAHDLFVPDIGIYRAARALNEVARKYRDDQQGEFGGVGKKRKQPLLPWKYHAERIKQATKALVDNTFNKPAALQAARSLQKEIAPVLKAMANHGAVDDADLRNLDMLVNILQPKSPTVFKTIEDAPIGN